MKNRWDSLSMKEKSELMKISITNGVTNLNTIKEIYNNYDEGGQINIYSGGTIDPVVVQGKFNPEPIASLLQTNPQLYRERMQNLSYDLQSKVIEQATRNSINRGGEYLMDAGKLVASVVNPTAGLMIAGADLGSTVIPGNTLTEEDKQDAYINAALEVAPYGINKLIDVVKLAKNISNPAYRAGHAYKTIAPIGYNDPKQRAKAFVKSMLSNTDPDIVKRQYNYDNKLSEYLPEFVKNREKISNEARDEAWKRYLGLKKDFKVDDYYKLNNDGTLSYNISKLKKESDNTIQLIGEERHDFLTGSGGGWSNIDETIPDTDYGRKIYTDIWDLHPFSRITDNPITNFTNKNSKYIPKGVNKQLNKIADKLSKFEVGSILGGKPFTMKTTIPYKNVIYKEGNQFILDKMDKTNYIKYIKNHPYIPNFDFDELQFWNTGIHPLEVHRKQLKDTDYINKSLLNNKKK